MENLFCVPEILRIVSFKLFRNPEEDLNNVINYIISRLSNELDKQISEHTVSEIKFQLNNFDATATGKEQLTQALATLASNINIEEIYDERRALFQEAIDERNYIKVLKIYNRKSLPDQICSNFALSRGELPNFVVRLANSDSKGEVKKALKGYFGDFAEKIV